MLNKKKSCPTLNELMIGDESNYRMLFNNTTDAILIANMSAGIIDVNVAACRLFGYSKKEFLKLSVRQLHPADRVKETLQIFRQLIRDDNLDKNVELQIITKNKKVRIVSANFGKVKINSRNCFIAFFRDITEKKESEMRYKILAETAHDSIYLVDRTGKVVYVNTFGAKQFNAKPAAIIGKDIEDLFPPAIAKRQKASIDRVFYSGQPICQENVSFFPSGEVWLSTQLTPIKDQKGRVENVMGFSRDISEIKKTEMAAKNNASLLNSVTVTSQDGILVIDSQGKIVFYNEKFLELWKIPQKLAKTGEDKKLLSFVVSQLSDAKEFLQKVKHLYRHPKEKSSDIIYFKDGRIFDRMSLPQKIDGNIVGRIWRFRDITERLKTEQELRENKQYLAKIIDFSPDATFAVDQNKRVTVWNRAMERMTGISAEDIIGKGDYAYAIPFYGVARPQLMDLFWSPKHEIAKKYPSLKKEGDDLVIEVFCPALYGGKGAFVWAKASPLRDSAGRLIGAIECVRDITERKKVENALILSEQKYRRLFEAAKDGILILDAESGEIREVNPYLVKILGYSRQEFLQKKLWEIGFLKDVVASKKSFEILKSKGYVHYENMPLRTRSGVSISVEFVSNVYAIDHTKVIQCNIRDITARHRAEMALVDSETRMRAIYENSPVAIVLIGLDNKFISANPAAVNLWGYSEKELRKRTFGDITHPDEIKRDTAQIKLLLKGKIPVYNVDKRYIKKDKKIIYCRVNTTLIKDNQKQSLYFLTIIEDITQHKEWEKEISQEKEKYSTLVENSHDAVVLIQNGVIKYVNSAIKDITGQLPQDVIGQPMINFIAPQYRNLVGDRYKRRMQGEKVENRYEFAVVDKHGKAVPVENNSSVVVLNGQPADMAILRDISKAKEVDRLKSEFVSMSSHQLRTPLTGIKWFGELLLKEKIGKLNSEQHDFVEQIYRSNERMIGLVNDLLDVSHIETGRKFVLNKKTNDLRLAFSRAVEDQTLAADKKKIGFVLGRGFKEKIICVFDFDKIVQMLNNLISNSLKYSPNKTKIIFDCRRQDDYWHLSITDQGYGIPQYQQHRIFERFFRADNIRGVAPEGTGLGLYIARGIIEAHGGRIWFDSKENKGTTFYFTLPLHPVK